MTTRMDAPITTAADVRAAVQVAVKRLNAASPPLFGLTIRKTECGSAVDGLVGKETYGPASEGLPTIKGTVFGLLVERAPFGVVSVMVFDKDDLAAPTVQSYECKGVSHDVLVALLIAVVGGVR